MATRSKRSPIEKALSDFLMSFEFVFGDDWEYTRDRICDPEFIKPNGTFLQPGVDDEGNNWASRGGLLAAYRRLVKAMKDHDAKIPSQLERELDAELAGVNLGIDVMEILSVDPDLDPVDADLVKFYAARLQRRRCALIAQADILTIESEKTRKRSKANPAARKAGH